MKSTTLLERIMRRVEKTSAGCWETRSKNRYSMTRFEGISKLTHRLMYEIHFGKIPNGMHVLHRCDNTHCCNPDHLFLGSHADNMRDMAIKGRAGGTIVTAHEVALIRFLSSCGVRSFRLAGLFEISQTHLLKIKNKTRWQHVEEMRFSQ